MKIARKTVSKPPTDWEQVESIFTNLSGIRPRKAWFGGVSERLNWRRLSRLLASREAKALDVIVSRLDTPELRRLRAMAHVNHEQAQSALRLTVFTNVTVIIATLAISNQISPGWIADVWADADAPDRLLIGIGSALGLIAAVGVSLYAYGGVASARDLKHLLELHASDVKDGPLVTDTVSGDPVSDIKDMQLSDV